jgi:hypothetical protein
MLPAQLPALCFAMDYSTLAPVLKPYVENDKLRAQAQVTSVPQFNFV